ncbi:DUF305 domain-containing protein [Streptomyces daliensis]
MTEGPGPRPGGRGERPLAAALLTLALALALPVLAACDSGQERDGAEGAGNRGEQSVVAPGRPGEKAKTLSPDEAKEAGGAETEPNTADFRYVRDMIAHHQQALTMTRLADEHAEAKKVRRLAERVAASQEPEIGAMRGWLKVNGDEGGDGDQHSDRQGHAHGHDHAKMPGMATEAQLDRLRAARGDDFDALFLSLMTAHHEGAVTMATDLLSAGNDVRVEEMATDVVAQQKAEIERMRKLR